MQCLFQMFYFLVQVCFVYLVILIIQLQLTFSHALSTCHTSSRVSRAQHRSCTCVGSCQVRQTKQISFRKSLKLNKLVFILSIFYNDFFLLQFAKNERPLFPWCNKLNFLYKLWVRETKAVAEDWHVWHDERSSTLDFKWGSVIN